MVNINSCKTKYNSNIQASQHEVSNTLIQLSLFLQLTTHLHIEFKL